MTSRPFNTYDGISVAQIILFTIFLAGAIFLNIKHGFGKSSGWRYLIILALARIIGGGMELGTISDPTNESLLIGWMILNGLGLGPLVLVIVGLLTRVFESINRQGHVFVKPMFLKLVQLLMLVGVILIIVGGTNSTYTIVDGHPIVKYNNLSQVGTGIMIAVIVLVCLTIAFAFMNQGYVAQGEHRIILGAAACMPFIIVRLAYSCALIFGHVRQTAYLMLGLSVIEEIIVVVICQVLGFSLGKAPPMPAQDEEMQGGQRQRKHRKGLVMSTYDSLKSSSR